MDGIHDMGGMHGFGKVEPEKNEPVFHDKWEGRTFALNRAMGYTGVWTIDQTRAGIEQLPPEVYLSSSYYRKWAIRMENLIVALGLADADEVAAGHALRPGKALKRKLTAADVPNSLSRGSFSRPANAPARIPGGRPGAHQEHSSGDAHASAALCARQGRRDRSVARLSRVSRYGRNRQGRKSAMALYRAVRRPRTLGRDTDPSLKVSIDAFEPYLEPA